jgi:POT family proton-dependent oligopeptide transporter
VRLSNAMTTVEAPVAAPAAREKQPAGLFLLFGVEMWERFSFYGMRALLVLYLVDAHHGGMGWGKETSQKLYGWYNFLVYLLPVAGGYLADRFIGTHRSMLIGAVIIACGHFCLAVPAPGMFFLGLGLIILGTGFFKSNVSTMVGQLYRQDDPRRDGGFTIFYMGVNLGALIGPLVCGTLAESPRFGWHWGFGAAGVGMVLGLVMYLTLKARYLPGIGLRPHATAAPGAAAPPARARAFTQDERRHVLALVVIYFFIIFFWTAFEQAGSSMNLFAAERTRLAFGSFTIPAAWFQSINPAVILLFAPVFAAAWDRLALKGRDPSTPAKMSVGLVLVGAGFIFMVVGARASDGGARVSPAWLVGAYTLHTFGELCLSPIGLSLVSRMAPKGHTSVFMGLWFVATAFAELLAGQLAAATDKVARGQAFHVFGGQADFFFIFVVSSVVAALALAALTPRLRRLMA